MTTRFKVHRVLRIRNIKKSSGEKSSGETSQVERPLLRVRDLAAGGRGALGWVLSVCMFVCLSVCLPDMTVCMFVWLFVCLTWLFDWRFVWLPDCLAACLSDCPSVWLTVRLSICLKSEYLFVWLTVFLFDYQVLLLPLNPTPSSLPAQEWGSSFCLFVCLTISTPLRIGAGRVHEVQEVKR